MTNINKFITDKYEDIMLMARKICRSHVESEEVGHYSIEKFMIHERADELIEANRAMQFLSGIIHRSFHSSTSQYHKDVRQKNRMHSLPSTTQLEFEDIDYNYEQDMLIDTIQVILEEMIADSKELYFQAVLFQMYSKDPNFSKISREVGIPRTTISRAVEDAKKHIKQQLKNRGLDDGL